MFEGHTHDLGVGVHYFDAPPERTFDTAFGRRDGHDMATRLGRSKRRCKVAPAPPDSEEALGLIMEELEDLRLFGHDLLQPVNASATFDLNSATEN